MNKLSKKNILDEATQLIKQKGIDSVSLTDIAKVLGTSHAALYKYFPNKNALLSALAQEWLDVLLIKLFPFNKSPYNTKADIVHDWLWTLFTQKRLAYQKDPEMFKLYTEYIDSNPKLLQEHMNALINSLLSATGWENRDKALAIIQAFILFSAPKLAFLWNEQSEQQFENIWALVAESLNG
ncbi:TetR/AcrR family transcriptional regulator [Oenococcus oeni]|uniref:TetR/AcrR family transcriptional regulator n=1 Tax=Oenococcus oeni TaxID=1247 RepID=UPI0008F939E9|nr:TetR/AcrR family transcriptional regulator [Oenococcus oeni]OIK88847.1 TetR family transcriptional regulator [Oenococcus oeni]OIL10791.1 TetR family transcriptional regulator [Oenococcus oeni]OIL16416.1 TetR family transcriptional regulator [Oenococcus oeni]SYW09107.1 TetR family transcriptional regulator [Oenococcus oeni]